MPEDRTGRMRVVSLVGSEVAMNRVSSVVRAGVVVDMRVRERHRQGGCLECHQQHSREDASDHGSFFPVHRTPSSSTAARPDFIP
jgi:hypothetical protein